MPGDRGDHEQWRGVERQGGEYLGEPGRTTKLVSVSFTSAGEDGIHAIYRGDAHLDGDRTFVWSHVERLTPVRG